MILPKESETKEELWEAYWQTGDIAYRNDLAMEYAYIVKVYAYQLRGIYENYATVEDMINQGTVALLEAVEKYDPTKKTKFESYASIRVKGAIIDYVRNQDWVAKRSKKKAKLVNEATDYLTNTLGRVPSIEELSQYLKMPSDAIEKILGEVHTFNLLSYEELIDIGLYGVKGFREQGIAQEEMPGYELENEELKQIISDSLSLLTEKERMVIMLYYYEGLKKKDIAYILDISASRVCQIHSCALKKMKNSLKQYLFGDEEE